MYKLFELIEKIFGVLQGKGFPSSTKREVSFFSHFLTKKPVLAIDIGGNIGDYTHELIRSYPDIKLHIFEPSAINFKTLSSRFSSNKNITINNSALSDLTTDGTLYSNTEGSPLGSLSKRNLDHFNIAFDTTESIVIEKFTDYWNNILHQSPIDIVKIDVEGHELAVLRGFGEALNYVHIIQFEFGGTCIDSRVFFRDFWLIFNRNNFKLYRLTPIGFMEIKKYSERDESFTYTNFYAVNTRFKQFTQNSKLL